MASDAQSFGEALRTWNLQTWDLLPRLGGAHPIGIEEETWLMQKTQSDALQIRNYNSHQQPQSVLAMVKDSGICGSKYLEGTSLEKAAKYYG